MNEISDGAIMAALGRQMTAAVQKQVVAAGNLANIDTPGYRTRDASFTARTVRTAPACRCRAPALR